MSFDAVRSEVDASVNFVRHLEPGRAVEARYVRREDEYFACYLSTQTACEQACRFCHLTATGQNDPTDLRHDEVLEQALVVLNHYHQEAHRARFVHFNFMARGEPLANRRLTDGTGWHHLLLQLGDLAGTYGLVPRFLVSTVLPTSLNRPLEDVFPVVQPDVYYSLYSVDPAFRRRWLPRAMDTFSAFALLRNWQRHSQKVVRIHHALIDGENDSEEDANQLASALLAFGIRADFNLVQYNPPTGRHGGESPRALPYAQALRRIMPEARVKFVPRVGFDVNASCGMFESSP